MAHWRLDGLANPPVCEIYRTEAAAEAAAKAHGLKTYVVWQFPEPEERA